MVFARLASIPTSTLVAVAGFGASVTACFGLYTRKSIQAEWAKKPFYQDAIKALRWRLILYSVEFTVAHPFFIHRTMAKNLQFEINSVGSFGIFGRLDLFIILCESILTAAAVTHFPSTVASLFTSRIHPGAKYLLGEPIIDKAIPRCLERSCR